MKVFMGILALAGVVFATTAAGPREVKYEIFLYNEITDDYIPEYAGSIAVTYDVGAGPVTIDGLVNVGNQHPHAAVWLPAAVRIVTVTAEADGYGDVTQSFGVNGKQSVGSQGLFVPMWPGLER